MEIDPVTKWITTGIFWHFVKKITDGIDGALTLEYVFYFQEHVSLFYQVTQLNTDNFSFECISYSYREINHFNNCRLLHTMLIIALIKLWIFFYFNLFQGCSFKSLGSALLISEAHQKNVDFVGALYQFSLVFRYEINKNVLKYGAIYKFLVKRVKQQKLWNQKWKYYGQN